MSYRTFKRTAKNFREFASAEKIIVDTGLTLAEARERCENYNRNRTAEEIENGTKLEFTKE